MLLYSALVLQLASKQDVAHHVDVKAAAKKKNQLHVAHLQNLVIKVVVANLAVNLSVDVAATNKALALVQ